MKIIGFNISNINASKEAEIPKASINTDVIFTDVVKHKVDLIADGEVLKASFKFGVDFKDSEKKGLVVNNSVSLSGFMLLHVSRDEGKDFLRSWKKKKIPEDKVLPLYNLILKKCSVKALQLEEEIGLPSHIPFPQVKPQDKQGQ